MAIIIISLATAVAEERYFIVATSTTIARVSLDGQRFQTVLSNLTNAVAIDYDYRYYNILHVCPAHCMSAHCMSAHS